MIFRVQFKWASLSPRSQRRPDAESRTRSRPHNDRVPLAPVVLEPVARSAGSQGRAPPLAVFPCQSVPSMTPASLDDQTPRSVSIATRWSRLSKNPRMSASTIQLTFRRSTVTAHDAPRPEAVTKPEELRLAAPESHRPLKNLVRGKLPSILLGYVNPGGARPCAHGRAGQPDGLPHPPRTLATQRPAAASFLKEWNASCRTSRGGVKTLFRVPLRYLRSAACDPRFCARRGPTALPFPPTTPQAPKNPCSPPSAVLWPNLTSRSSSAYGISSAAPPRQRGKTSQVPASAMVLGPRGAPLTNAARCLRPRPRHSGFKASRGSIACRSPTLRLTTHGSRRN